MVVNGVNGEYALVLVNEVLEEDRPFDVEWDVAVPTGCQVDVPGPMGFPRLGEAEGGLGSVEEQEVVSLNMVWDTCVVESLRIPTFLMIWF